MTANRVLVLYAHSAPHLSRVNRRLADSAQLVDGVYLHDLYEAYPDFYIDVARERSLLAQADVLVFLHPIQWYSMPALLKEWLDVVLQEGWSHGADDNALKGKRYWLVATTGSPREDYAAGARHGRPFEQFLAPFAQTAALCGMEWIAPHILHGAHEVDAATVDAHVAGFRARLQLLAGAPPRLAPSADSAESDHGT
ncbi:MAG: NAD(P)H-dependent oxidoreductase [Pseudomonadota bacterium]|nr:NAD(P)H-dependent oxidoreductase [Pseudomonadota bacterium]